MLRRFVLTAIVAATPVLAQGTAAPAAPPAPTTPAPAAATAPTATHTPAHAMGNATRNATPATATQAAQSITLPNIGPVVSAEHAIPQTMRPSNLPAGSYVKATGNTQTPFDVYDRTGKKLGTLAAGVNATAPLTFRAATN